MVHTIHEFLDANSVEERFVDLFGYYYHYRVM